MIYDSRIVEHINRNLIGEIHSPEGSIIEQVASEEIMEAKPVSSKSVSIYFNTNSSDLDPNAKMILNREFELEATTNTGAYIRIVGNTDNTGSSDYNRQLSKRRAQAVADYMSSQWGIEKNRIIVIGNGPEKAIEDGVSGSNDMYRRTDFEIVANI